jgi:hypothetical protein
MAEMLTRDQIDTILEGMTGADLVDQMGDSSKPALIGPNAFDAAAKRQGIVNGQRAMELVSVQDFAYLAGRIAEVINLDGPKADTPDESQPSAFTGE